jgi:hypothetical protein
MPRAFVQLVCFGPCLLQGSQLFLVIPPQQSKISRKHVFLYSPGLKEQIPVFIIIFRPKLQELCGVEVTPPLSTGANTYLRRASLEAFTSYTPVRTPKFCDFFKVLGKC